MRILDNTSCLTEGVKTMTMGALPSPSLSAKVKFCQLPKEALSIKEQLLFHLCRENMPNSTAQQGNYTH